MFSLSRIFTKNCLTILLVFFSLTFTKAQNVDSLKIVLSASKDNHQRFETCLELVEHLKQKRKIKEAFKYGQKALRLASLINTPESVKGIYIGKSYIALGDLYFKEKKYQKADSLYTRALSHSNSDSLSASIYLSRYDALRTWKTPEEYLFALDKTRELIGDDTLGQLMVHYYNAKACYFLDIEDNLQALDHLMKAKQQNTSAAYGIVINHNLSIIYQLINDIDKSLALDSENRKLTKEIGDHLGELYSLYGVAYSQLGLEKYQDIITTFEDAIELSKKYNITKAIGFMYYCKGMAHLGLNEYDSAFHYFHEGVRVSEKQGERKEWVDCNEGLVTAYYKIGDYEKAKFYGEMVEEVDHKSEKRKEMLADIYAKENNYQGAYELILDNWKNLKTKEEKATVTKTINALLTQQFEQNQKIEQQNFQQKLKSQKIKTAFIILSCILVFISTIILFQYKNVRKLKNLNNTLTKRNETLQQYTYITSHDLKEPLRSITSFSQLLKRDIQKEQPSVDRQLEYISFIENSSKTLFEITDSLKTYTEVSVQEIKKEESKIEEVFDIVKNNLTSLVENKKGQLHFLNPESISSINFSKSLLVLIIQNLVKNGFKYNQSSQPKVEVSILKKGQQYLFRIKDNGVGIPDEYQELIFKPFKTLKNKSLNNSAGLGLTICKSIIEKSGGKIWLNSKKDQGSSFEFII